MPTKEGATTLRITTLSITTLSQMKLSIMTLSITTLSITTLIIMTLSITTNKTFMRNVTYKPFMLNVVKLSVVSPQRQSPTHLANS
jgi:hypothetical protein